MGIFLTSLRGSRGRLRATGRCPLPQVPTLSRAASWTHWPHAASCFRQILRPTPSPSLCEFAKMSVPLHSSLLLAGTDGPQHMRNGRAFRGCWVVCEAAPFRRGSLPLPCPPPCHRGPDAVSSDRKLGA